MRCRQKFCKAGDVLPVNNSDYHYQLPSGLKAGTLVRLLAFDHGYWTVEADGPQWLEQNDQRLIAAYRGVWQELGRLPVSRLALRRTAFLILEHRTPRRTLMIRAFDELRFASQNDSTRLHPTND